MDSLQGHAHCSYQDTNYVLFWVSPASTLMSRCSSTFSAPHPLPHACDWLTLCLSLTRWLPTQYTHTSSPVFFLGQQNPPFSGPSYTPVLVSYWFTRWSCESQAVSFCPTGEPMGTKVHSSISFLLPIYSEISNQPITRLVTCFHAGIFSTYSTLNMKRYVSPNISWLSTYCMTLYAISLYSSKSNIMWLFSLLFTFEVSWRGLSISVSHLKYPSTLRTFFLTGYLLCWPFTLKIIIIWLQLYQPLQINILLYDIEYTAFGQMYSPTKARTYWHCFLWTEHVTFLATVHQNQPSDLCASYSSMCYILIGHIVKWYCCTFLDSRVRLWLEIFACISNCMSLYLHLGSRYLQKMLCNVWSRPCVHQETLSILTAFQKT